MHKVDIFSPFQSRPDHHEDRLSWGLMVTLKYAPELQRMLRDLVIGKIPAGRWPIVTDWEPASVSTQTAKLGTDAAFVVSVLLSDASLNTPVDVRRSDRTARYDGVVQYTDGLVFVIENKPRRSNVRIPQLSPSRDSFTDLSDDVELFERVVSLEWAEVLEGILNYTGSQVATYPVRSLAGDFLRFVENLHPALSPYRTFELCSNRQEALARRIEALLNSIGQGIGYEVGNRPGARQYLDLPLIAVRQLHLSIGNSEDQGFVLMLNIWPGDTVRQARAFHERVKRDAFLDLETQGWQIRPNLHFSHMQKHLVWANTELRVSEYFDYFATNFHEIGKKIFEEISLADLIIKWEGDGLISAVDTEKLQREFGETKRSFINVIPGFNLASALPMAKIIEFERSHRLEHELLDSLRDPLSTWGESIPPWASI